MDVMAYHPRHPFAPPDRRWRRAFQLRAGRLRARGLDDAWVRRARRFLAVLERHGDDLDHPRVVAADPLLAAALGLRATSTPHLKHEVEARLLAGEGNAAIAAKVGLEPRAVAAYHNVFFDVRGGLGATDLVAAVILGPRLYRGEGYGDPELAARLVGWRLGPLGVDPLFGRLGGDEALARQVRLFVLAATAPVGDAEGPRWVALAERAARLDRDRAASSVGAVFTSIAIPTNATAPAGLPALGAGAVARRVDAEGEADGPVAPRGICAPAPALGPDSSPLGMAV
jgi:hypothetical protein